MARVTTWTEEETRLLWDLAKQGLTLTEAVQYLPGRTREEARHRARTLGIRFRRSKSWRRKRDYIPTLRVDNSSVNTFDGVSELSRRGYRQLELGLAILAKHLRRGRVAYRGVSMPILDAIGGLLELLHLEARRERDHA